MGWKEKRIVPWPFVEELCRDPNDHGALASEAILILLGKPGSSYSEMAHLYRLLARTEHQENKSLDMSLKDFLD